MSIPEALLISDTRSLICEYLDIKTIFELHVWLKVSVEYRIMFNLNNRVEWEIYECHHLNEVHEDVCNNMYEHKCNRCAFRFCSIHTSKCTRCGDQQCIGCLNECHNCSERLCDKCVTNKCKICLKIYCETCNKINNCNNCFGCVCKDCFDKCLTCNTDKCKECTYQCINCNNKACRWCLYTCSNQRCKQKYYYNRIRKLCKTCIKVCVHCNKPFCDACVKGCTCRNKMI